MNHTRQMGALLAVLASWSSTAPRFARLPRIFALLIVFSGCLGQAFSQPDYYGEDYKRSLAFYKNVGQKINSLGQVESEIAYSTNSGMPELCLRKKSTLSVWWTDFAPTGNGNVITAVNRIDIRPVGELSSNVTPNAEEIVSDKINVYSEYEPQGILDIPGYQKINYANIYDNIDMRLYSGASGAKLSFVCWPGSNPSNIILNFTGQDSVNLDIDGALKLFLNNKWVELKQAVVYQYDQNNNIIPVQWTANYEPVGSSANVQLHFDTYDTSLPLVFLIGQAMGGGGNNPDGVLWSTNHSGNGIDEFYAVEHDPAGNIYAGGYSYTGLFPVTTGSSVNPGQYTGTLVKFNADYERIWATYYGGSQADEVKSLAYSPNNDMLYGTGYTLSNDFPLVEVPDAYNNQTGTNYILRIDPNTGIATWATKLGLGKGLSIACGTSGEKYLVGYAPNDGIPIIEQNESYNQVYGGGDFDGSVFKFNSADQLIWSTYVGGPADDEYLEGVCIDGGGAVYILGMSSGANFPLVNPGGNAFFQGQFAGGGADWVILKFLSTGELLYSSYFGGESDDVSPGGSSKNLLRT